MTKEIHPYAEIFPRLDEERMDELVLSIKGRGLREPIALYKDQILDGRNRYVACHLAKIKPRFIDSGAKTDEEALLFVVDRNLQRRDLSPSDRAVCAAEAETLLEEARQRALKRMSEGGVKGRQVVPLKGDKGCDSSHTLRASDEVGQIFGVSGRLVDRARAVKRENPKLFQRVKAGEITVGQAYKEVRPAAPTIRSKYTTEAAHLFHAYSNLNRALREVLGVGVSSWLPEAWDKLEELRSEQGTLVREILSRRKKK